MKKENILLVVLVIFLLFVGTLTIRKISKNNKLISDNDKNTNNFEYDSNNGNNNDNSNNIKYDNKEDKSMPATLSANKKMNKPQMIIDQNKTYEATLHTSEGDIVISLNTKETPITANNFISLAQSGFYDKTIFHRVIDGFMIQGGDPRGDGTGGPGYKFDDEKFQGEYTRGTIAMANAGPNTNGSQFFIMHKDYQLQPNYVIFGKVISGIEVVDKIATAKVGSSFSGEMSKPVNPVSIKSVTVEAK